MLGGVAREGGQPPAGRAVPLSGFVGWHILLALRRAGSSDRQRRKQNREGRACGRLPVPNCGRLGLLDLEEGGGGLGSTLQRRSRIGAWMRAAVAYLAGRRRVQQNRQRKMTASQQRYSLGVLVCRLAIAAQGK